MSENKSKMYILLLDDPAIDLGHRILAASHASLSGFLTFVDFEVNEIIKSNLIMEVHPTHTEDWAKNSFRKVVCKVTKEEFTKAKTYGENMKDYRVMVEMGLGGMEVAIVVRPRNTSEDNSFNRFLKSLKLYK